MITQTTTNLIREDDELQHVEDTSLFTVIRNNHLVEVSWNELTESERRAIYVTLFNPCGLEGEVLMFPESSSTTYDLGHHALEITQDHTLLIATHPSADAPIPELVQLDHDEVYKLFITLKEVFQPSAE